MGFWKTPLLVAAVVLLAVACAGSAPLPTPTVIRETETIPAGHSVTWDTSAFDECQYHFSVKQTGLIGDIHIEFQGEQYVEKDGTFFGDSFVLSNEHSLSSAKVVDLLLRCQ